MASASIKEIKNRINSIRSTRQITGAMELVAASKLRKAQQQIESSRPYFRLIYALIQDILSKNNDRSLPYLESTDENGRLGYIVMAGDRGLAGGYNANVLKASLRHMEQKNVRVLPIGKRAEEFFASRRYEMIDTAYAHAESVSVGDCFTVASTLCKAFKAGVYSELWLSYTECESVLTQTPRSIKLLPLEREPGAKISAVSDILYEPSGEEAFEAMIPEYIGGVIYGALCESRASEQAARRAAMETATQNADDMIDELSLKYNQARQAAITQEITEIVAGS